MYYFILSLRTELASVWYFSGPRIEIFYFGLDRKIPKSRGSGVENPEKIPLIPGNRDRDFKTSKKSRKNPECEKPEYEIPKSRESWSAKSLKSQKWWRSRAKRPGLCKIHEIRDFLPLGYPGIKKDRDFLRGIRYPDKKPPLLWKTFLNIVNLKQGRCGTESYWVYLYRLVYNGIFDTFGGFCQ